MIKEFIALIFLLGFSIPTVQRLFSKKIDNATAGSILVFTIVGSLLIANYDVIQTLRWGNLEIETVKKEIFKIKESAIEDIKTEVNEQKESIKLLISSANETREKTEQQKNSLTELIKKASELQKSIEIQKTSIQSLNQEGLKTKSEIQKLNRASTEIALILVRITYLTVETKNELGTERVQKAIELIISDLNKILPLIIPDEHSRSKWIQDLTNSLPVKK